MTFTIIIGVRVLFYVGSLGVTNFLQNSNGLSQRDFVGTWEYDDYYIYIDVSSDGTYTMYMNESADEIVTYTDDDGVTIELEDLPYEVYSDGIVLYYDADCNNALLGLEMDSSDKDVMTDTDGYTLFKSKLP